MTSISGPQILVYGPFALEGTLFDHLQSDPFETVMVRTFLLSVMFVYFFFIFVSGLRERLLHILHHREEHRLFFCFVY